MNPPDRINQLNDEIALLRSQLADARKQLEADSATIAKLAMDKQGLANLLGAAHRLEELTGKNLAVYARTFSALASSALSRHA